VRKQVHSGRLLAVRLGEGEQRLMKFRRHDVEVFVAQHVKGGK